MTFHIERLKRRYAVATAPQETFFTIQNLYKTGDDRRMRK